MKKGKVFFNPIDGSGSLSISWSSKPKGDSTEATKGSGVGFFSESGDLLCVIFDEVNSNDDCQILEFKGISIEVTVKSGKVSYKTISKSVSPSSPRARSKRKHPISK